MSADNFSIERLDEQVVPCSVVRKRDSQGRMILLVDGAKESTPVARQDGPGSINWEKFRGGSPENK
jgi:hypothetical protein